MNSKIDVLYPTILLEEPPKSGGDELGMSSIQDPNLGAPAAAIDLAPFGEGLRGGQKS